MENDLYKNNFILILYNEVKSFSGCIPNPQPPAPRRGVVRVFQADNFLEMECDRKEYKQVNELAAGLTFRPTASSFTAPDVPPSITQLKFPIGMQYKRASTIRCAIGMYQCNDAAMKFFCPDKRKKNNGI